MNRLHQRYNTEIAQQLFEQLKLANVNQTPRLTKIVVAAGVGRATQDSKHLDIVVDTLAKITAQHPIETVAKHSIATFKLREGNKIGAKVTLRGERMWYFLDRLIAIVIPRLRDFHGLSLNAFDGQGNYTIGIDEQTVFPEISNEQTAGLHGLQITLVTTATDKKSAETLLRDLGLPLEKKEDRG